MTIKPITQQLETWSREAEAAGAAPVVAVLEMLRNHYESNTHHQFAAHCSRFDVRLQIQAADVDVFPTELEGE